MSTRGPNREEQLVIDCLLAQGYNEIVFEPDGNIPPDILLNNRIAIEVRRINQNISKGDEFEGLEQVEYPVHNMVTGILDSYPSVDSSNSALVSYSFRRPLPPLKERTEILEILSKHESIVNQRRKYTVGENFEMEFWPLSERMPKTLMYAASSDQDSGGYIVGLIMGLRRVLAEFSQIQ